MNQVVTIPTNTLDKILRTLIDLKKEVAKLTEKIEQVEPVYGSDEWWAWSDKKAMEDIKAGRGVSFNNIDDMQKYLDSLKSE